uniref:periplasmic nitrate reductase, NapE protein n=1 Tax=Edaphosphingomonas laterariae TaxID=861865 RepID=UPI000B7787EA|nr:periplasmic nitrate reductase, NapE protein [Sphingomonas laterariae]
MEQHSHPPRKRTELQLFLFLTIILFPILAVGLVATYGFIVWMWQLVAGPPSVY